MRKFIPVFTLLNYKAGLGVPEVKLVKMNEFILMDLGIFVLESLFMRCYHETLH